MTPLVQRSCELICQRIYGIHLWAVIIDCILFARRIAGLDFRRSWVVSIGERGLPVPAAYYYDIFDRWLIALLHVLSAISSFRWRSAFRAHREIRGPQATLHGGKHTVICRESCFCWSHAKFPATTRNCNSHATVFYLYCDHVQCPH